MKRKFTVLIIIIGIIVLFLFNRELFFKLQQIQLKIMRQFVFSVKKNDVIYWSLLIFSYGVIHSIGPGHGKTYLLTLHLKHKKPTLILYSAFIAYTQALISFVIIYVIFGQNKAFNALQVKYLDEFGKHLYGITLILLALFNMVNEFTERKIKDKFFVVGVFFPCSGVLSLLLTITVLGHREYLFPSTIIMSTGMFCTLAVFSMIIDKINFKINHENRVNKIIFSYYILLLLIGIYVLVR